MKYSNTPLIHKFLPVSKAMKQASSVINIVFPVDGADTNINFLIPHLSRGNWLGVQHLQSSIFSAQPAFLRFFETNFLSLAEDVITGSKAAKNSKSLATFKNSSLALQSLSGLHNGLVEILSLMMFSSFSSSLSFTPRIKGARVLVWPTDYDCPMKPFPLKFRAFGLGQTNWEDKFWGILDIYGQTISNLLVQWVPCLCFPSFNHFFYKKLSLYIMIHIPIIYLRLGFVFGPQRIRELAFVCP